MLEAPFVSLYLFDSPAYGGIVVEDIPIGGAMEPNTAIRNSLLGLLIRGLGGHLIGLSVHPGYSHALRSLLFRYGSHLHAVGHGFKNIEAFKIHTWKLHVAEMNERLIHDVQQGHTRPN